MAPKSHSKLTTALVFPGLFLYLGITISKAVPFSLLLSTLSRPLCAFTNWVNCFFLKNVKIGYAES